MLFGFSAFIPVTHDDRHNGHPALAFITPNVSPELLVFKYLHCAWRLLILSRLTLLAATAVEDFTRNVPAVLGKPLKEHTLCSPRKIQILVPQWWSQCQNLQHPASMPLRLKRTGLDCDEAPQVSVVVPSYNSRGSVEACLRSIHAQDTPRNFEVIIVDTSSDGTDHLVQGNFPDVTLIHLPERRTVGQARNLGVRAARSDMILFLDADCIASSTWVESMCNALIEHEADGICGAIDNGTPGSVSGSVGYLLEFYRFLSYSGRPVSAELLVGGNSGFRRCVFDHCEFVDENLGDDFLFSLRLKKLGYKLLFFPGVPVRHLNKTGFSRVMRYQYAIGRGAERYRRQYSPRLISFLEKAPVLAFLLPFGILPWMGAIVGHRKGVFSFLTFIIFLPPLLMMNLVWAFGFFAGLRQHLAGARSGPGATSPDPSTDAYWN